MPTPSSRYFAILILISFLCMNIVYEPSSGVILDDNISLTVSNGSFIGEKAGDKFGTTVAFAGDVNGDGYDDILISSYVYDTASHGGTDVGKIYLVFGNSTSNTKDMDIGNANASFVGEGQWNYAGISMDGAGDVNGDGYDDIIISSLGNNGEIYLIFGKNTGWSRNTSLSNSDASFLGESTNSGRSVSKAGDVNNDGFDDIIIGAQTNSESHGNAGQTYLILGRSGSWSMNTSLSNANASFLGEEGTDRSGSALSDAGDVNGDGYDDFLIGAPENDQVGGGQSGKIYLIYGRPTGWSMDTDLSYANASFVGDQWVQQGRKVSAAGDVNGDGYDDFLVSSGSDLGGNGRAFLIFGGVNLGTNVSLYNVNASFNGEGYLDGLEPISEAGDLNNDGFDDILISAPVCVRNGAQKGKTYVFYGKKSGWSMNTSVSQSDASLIGEVDYDRSGYSIAGGGDVNNDGRPDILISSIINDEGGTDAGQVYLILNEPNTPPVITTTDITNSDEDTLYSVHYLGADYETADEELTWDCHTDAIWLSFNSSSKYLNGTPTNDDVGSFWVNITVEDEHEGTDWTNFTLTVNNVNDPPVIMTTDIHTVDEDTLYSVQYMGIDIDPTMDVITWSLISNASWLSIDPTYGYLNGTPDNFDVGAFWVNVTADDGNDGTDWTNFTLTVNNVNDAPVLTRDHILYVDEDDLYSVRYDAIDIDPTNDVINWDILTNAGWITSYYNGRYAYLNGTPRNIDVGTYYINITVDDGNDGWDWFQVDIQVNNTNDDPEIQTDDMVTTNEDEFYSIHYSATDIDPTLDVFSWSMDSDADWLIIDESSGYLNGTPDNDDVGTFWVNVTVQDGNGGFDWSRFDLEVLNVNDDPVITEDAVTSTNEDEFYSIILTATDIDPTMDTFTWSFISDAEWLVIDEMQGYLNGTPTNDDVGTYWINVTADDGNGGTDWYNFTIEVLNINDDPVILPVELMPAIEDVFFTVSFQGVDIDPSLDTLTWSLETNADWLAIDTSTGEINGTPENGDVGEFWVNLSVSDGNGGSDWTNFTTEVLNVNDDPMIAIEHSMTADEDALYLVTYIGDDIDPTNDTLTWSLITDADWLSMDPITGNLTGTPDNEDVGTFNVSIQLSDGNEGFVWSNFTLEVVNTNDRPEITTNPMTMATEDELYEVTFEAVDEDPTDDTLTWSFDTDATWLSFDPETGILTGIPTNDDVGFYLVSLNVSDGYSWFNMTFFITVVNSNDPPVWGHLVEDMVINEDITSHIEFHAFDPDPESEITFTITTDPSSSLVILSSSRWIIWEEGTTGTYLVNISASDGTSTIYQEFTVTFPDEDTSSSDSDGFPWWIIIVIIIIVIVMILLFLIFGRKKKEEEQPDAAPVAGEE